MVTITKIAMVTITKQCDDERCHRQQSGGRRGGGGGANRTSFAEAVEKL